MPSITMTMTSSISVKPSSCLLMVYFSLLCKRAAAPARPSVPEQSADRSSNCQALSRTIAGCLQSISPFLEQARCPQAEQCEQAAARGHDPSQPQVRANELVGLVARLIEVRARQAR